MHFLLLEERPIPRRVVLIGHALSAEFCIALEHAGFDLCIIGGGSGLEELRGRIIECAPAALRHIALVYQATGPYVFREGDAVVLLRVLHHAETSADMLADVSDAMPRGSVLLVADTTSELMCRQQEEWIDTRRQIAERLTYEEAEAFEQAVAEREADDAICYALLERHRFTDEQSIRGF